MLGSGRSYFDGVVIFYEYTVLFPHSFFIFNVSKSQEYVCTQTYAWARLHPGLEF